MRTYVLYFNINVASERYLAFFWISFYNRCFISYHAINIENYIAVANLSVYVLNFKSTKGKTILQDLYSYSLR